jgi:hypothetical protein
VRFAHGWKNRSHSLGIELLSAVERSETKSLDNRNAKMI